MLRAAALFLHLSLAQTAHPILQLEAGGEFKPLQLRFIRGRGLGRVWLVEMAIDSSFLAAQTGPSDNSFYVKTDLDEEALLVLEEHKNHKLLGNIGPSQKDGLKYTFLLCQSSCSRVVGNVG